MPPEKPSMNAIRRCCHPVARGSLLTEQKWRRLTANEFNVEVLRGKISNG
jgi:hypothetical protein